MTEIPDNDLVKGAFDDTYQTARFCKVLSSQTRIDILKLLHENGDMYMQEISKELGKTVPSISVDFQKMEEVGLIECRYATGTRGVRKFARITVRRVSLLFFGGGQNDEEEE